MPQPVSSRRERALDLFRRGDEAGARREAEAALAEQPADPELLRLLGTLSCRAGALGEGIAHFRRALELAPADPALKLDLATALAAAGQAEEALRLAPADAADRALVRLRGQILQALARNAEAAEAYERVLSADGNDLEVWNNLGNARLALGDSAGAVEALRRAVELRPDILPIQANLGAALIAAGDLEGAAAAFRRALPLGASVQLVLVRLLQQLGRSEEALDLLASDSPGAELQVERGRILSGLRRLDEAEQAYRAALAADRHNPQLWLELGILLERAGRADELGPLLAEAAAQGIPARALAYLDALRLQQQGQAEEALAAALRAPADVEPARVKRLTSRLADRTGQPALAFAAAAEANRLLAEEHPDAPARAAVYRAHVAALAATLAPEWVARWRPYSPAAGRPAPAFLVAFPRSGTTLLDTMLMGHPDLHVVEEEPLLDRLMGEIGAMERVADLDGAEIERLRARYFDMLDDVAPPPAEALVVDKLPLNILAAPLIHRLFPDAKFILALRHPGDVVLSCFMQGFEMNDAMANFRDIGETAELYDLVLGYWSRCRELLALDVFESRYEALVAEPEPRLRALIDFLGVEWSDSVLDHQRTARARGTISTPSYNQVTQRLYGDSSGRWRRYADQLAPALPVIEKWESRLGYDS